MSTTSYIFEQLRPRPARESGRRRAEAARVHAPLRRLRGLLRASTGPTKSQSPQSELEDLAEDAYGRVYTRAPAPPKLNLVPTGAPANDAEGRRPAGVRIDGEVLTRFPDPVAASSSSTRRPSPTGAGKTSPSPPTSSAHVHPENMDAGPARADLDLPPPGPDPHATAPTPSGSTRSPTPTRCGSTRATRQESASRPATSCASTTEIGYFVVKAWVTEGIQPGVVACSHHMGRWRLKDNEGEGQRQMMATASLSSEGSEWGLKREKGAEPYASSDPDTERIWWTDVGVHQNLTFPVHPDPVSGMHCWHQAVRVTKAEAGDVYGDISVDTAASVGCLGSGWGRLGGRGRTRRMGRGGRGG